MNLTIAKDQILIGLQAVQNVVSTRTTLPILSNVLLRAEADCVEFTATDLDVTVACKVEAKVKKGGSTTVPVKKLFGIVRELGGNEIDIETDEKNITSIRCNSSFYKIHGLNADEFPPLPKFKDDKKVSLPQENLLVVLELGQRRKFIRIQAVNFIKGGITPDAGDVFFVGLDVNFITTQLPDDAEKLFHRHCCAAAFFNLRLNLAGDGYVQIRCCELHTISFGTQQHVGKDGQSCAGADDILDSLQADEYLILGDGEVHARLIVIFFLYKSLIIKGCE